MRDKNVRYQQRKARVKSRITLGTSGKPRLVVNRTNTRFFAQIIDDTVQRTILGMDTRTVKVSKGDTKTILAQKLGEQLAQEAKKLKIEKVIFDRNGYLYHGRVKAFCEGVRNGGITF